MIQGKIEIDQKSLCIEADKLYKIFLSETGKIK